MATQISLGIALAALIGYLGYRRRALSRSGVVGAIITGGLLFGLGGFSGAALLLTFFISSSALSRFRESQKESLVEKFSKGSQRDLGQALANAGAAAACMVGWAITGEPIWWVACAAALAEANADTWATELGVLNKTPPRLITGGRPVEVGASGGVSLGGTAAALAGSALIAFVAVITIGFDPSFLPLRSSALQLFFIITLSGLAGSFFDSLLGATAQAIYYCDRCRKETERYPTHRCGAPTRLIRGWKWLDNDWVNFLATGVGALIASSLLLLIW